MIGFKHTFKDTVWYELFLQHPHDTSNPQGYWVHGLFSVVNSLKGMQYMLAGILHGIFPFLFAFSTSSFIIRSFVKLVRSNRHSEELQQYVSESFLDTLEKQIGAPKN